MVHYAGYVPRFRPSDFETASRDGVGCDWPISYWDLKPYYEQIEEELPVSGQDWPWGDRHSYGAAGANAARAALSRWPTGRARLARAGRPRAFGAPGA